MKKKEVLVDVERMYALTQDSSGKLFLEVVVGGFALENLIIPLTSDEQLAYRANGKPALDELAYNICKEPEKFSVRIK